MLLKGIISKEIKPLESSLTVDQAIAILSKYEVKHLALVKGKKYVGIVSLTLLLEQANKQTTLSKLELDATKGFVSANTHIFELVRIAADIKQTTLPVLNAKDEYVGSIKTADIITLMADQFAFNIPGGIIVLEVSHNGYSLTEIAGIIESNDVKVLSLFTLYHASTSMLDINIKLNKEEIEPILQTFERYNYSVKAVYSEYHMVEELKERYHALINYLNI